MKVKLISAAEDEIEKEIQKWADKVKPDVYKFSQSATVTPMNKRHISVLFLYYETMPTPKDEGI